MSPRQIKIAIIRQQNRLALLSEKDAEATRSPSPPLAKTSKSVSGAGTCATTALLPARVRLLRAQPDFESLCGTGAVAHGTPAVSADKGDIHTLRPGRVDAREFAAPTSCRMSVLPPNTVPWVDDTALA